MLSTDNKIRFRLNNGSTVKTLNSDTAIDDTLWHHIAFVRNGNSLKFYLNGTEDATEVDLT